MANRNLFSRKNLKPKSSPNSASSFSSATTSNENSTLPSFNSDHSTFEFTYIKNGEQKIAVFDCKQKIDHRYLSNAEKQDKNYFPWFHPLFKNKPEIAVEITRVLLKFLQDQNTNTHVLLAFKLLAEYIIACDIKDLTSFKLKDFDSLANKINSQYARGTTVYIVNQIKKIFKFTPSISDSISEKIEDYRLTYQSNEDGEVTFEQRVKNAGLTNDYSDYVMFQIYAYVNACISEIKDCCNSLSIFIESEHYKSFFTTSGRLHYRQLIERGDIESFDQAFQIELAECYRINDALDSIYLHDQLVFENFLKHIRKKDYLTAYHSLPVSLQEYVNIQYLCHDVFPHAFANNTTTIRKATQNIWTESGIRFLSWSNRITNNWRDAKKFFTNHDKYKTYIHSKHFIYKAFYGDRVNEATQSSSPGEGIHNILLGRTNHFDFLLMVLLMCESGRNLEVITSIPAKIGGSGSIDSILQNQDKFSSEESVLLFGFKVRGHLSGKGIQREDLSLPKSSALFKYLNLYEKLNLRLTPNHDTFFGHSKIIKNYAQAFVTNCEIKEKDGSYLTSLETAKFRKVFSGEMLTRWTSKIKNKDDLIRAVANDLKNTIPLTYLLQSSTTESMLSTAIVGLQMKFIESHLRVSAELKLNSEKTPKSKREKRFLCDCLDPTAPDFTENINISYCKQFDNCLGCSRAVVYEEHLKNIIYRCFQYEQLLRANRDLYQANYEAKHYRANEVISRFKLKADDGELIFAEAFNEATISWENPNSQLLPPLIHGNI